MSDLEGSDDYDDELDNQVSKTSSDYINLF